MSLLVMDCETKPAPDEVLASLMPRFEPAENLRDPAKIERSIAEQEAKWRERAALSALTGRVVLVGVLDEDEDYHALYDGMPGIGEKELLAAWWNDWWLDYDDPIGGWNIKGFDLPFLVQRSWILGVTVPRDVISGRYFHPKVHDFMEAWGCFQYGQRTALDSVARALGLAGKSATGKDSLTMDMQALIAYNENDCRVAAAVGKRLGLCG